MRAKQVILVRTDLNMPSGKIAAQAAHGAVSNILNLLGKEEYSSAYNLEGRIEYDSAEDAWINGSFFKVVLAVDSEEQLLDIYERAKERDLNTSLITDQGHTCFNMVPTNTVVAIGPHWDDAFEGLTDKLRLL